MKLTPSVRAYFRVRPRGFVDGIRLFATFISSAFLKAAIPARFRSVGLAVHGSRNLHVAVDGIEFEVRPRTNDLDLISPKHEPLTTDWFRVGANDIHLYADSLPAVQALREHGVRTALVSNCSHNTRAVVERLGLEAAFDAVILSFEVGAQKPEPEIYRLALERLGITKPSRAVFVDDQADYCDGAAAIGMQTRLMLRPREPVEDFAPSTNGHPVIREMTALL